MKLSKNLLAQKQMSRKNMKNVLGGSGSKQLIATKGRCVQSNGSLTKCCYTDEDCTGTAPCTKSRPC